MKFIIIIIIIVYPPPRLGSARGGVRSDGKFILLPKGVGELLSYVQCASPSISRMPVSRVILQVRPVE